MYMDIDSILFSAMNDGQDRSVTTEQEWISCIDHLRLTQEDLCMIYGSWAEDAAKSAFLALQNDVHSCKDAYAA